MSPVFIIGVLVAVGEGGMPATRAMVLAATEALEAGVSFVVKDERVPNDREALAVEDQLRAAAVIELIWSNAAQTNAHVRVHVARGDRWIDRRIVFSASDTAAERGRTVGFTLASILSAETALAPRREQASVVRPAAGDPLPAGSPPPALALANDPRGPSVGLADASSPRFAIELTGVVSRGLGGPASGIGAATHLEFPAGRAVWVRGGGGFRSAAVPGLNGNDNVWWGAIGGAWRQAAGTGTFGAALCVDLDLLFHDISHASSTGGTVHGSHLLPGATAFIEGTLRLSRSWEMVLGAGVEAAFGKTEVYVDGQPIAAIPVVRGLAALGLRLAI